MRLLALHCNLPHAFCGGDFLDAAITQSLNFLCRRHSWLWSRSHNSRLAQLIGVIPVLGVFMVHGLEIVFNIICWNLWSYRLKPGRVKGPHPMILTNPSVSVNAPKSLATAVALSFG